MSHSFIESINKFGFSLTESLHNENIENENIVQSSLRDNFGNVFSKVFGVHEEEIFSGLDDPSLERIKDDFLFREFSHQKSWIKSFADEDNSAFLLILSSCSTLAHKFKFDIIIITDILNFAIFHSSYSAIRIFSEKNNGNFVVVGLDEGNKLHHLTFNGSPYELEERFETIPTQAILSIDEIIGPITDGSRLSTNIYSDVEIGGEEVKPVTIKTFLADHFQRTPKGLKISENSFSNNEKIDFYGSDVRFEKEITLSFERSYDIDGFFGLFSGSQLIVCIKGGGQIVAFKDYTQNTKEMASLKKLFEDTGHQHLTKRKCIKFADLESTSSFELYAVVASESSCKKFENFDLKSCLESAHLYANGFPCMNSGCENLKEHRATKHGRPDYHTQITSFNFKWGYEAKSFGCLLLHMINSLSAAIDCVDGLKTFYYVKSIGSKFKTIFTVQSDLLKSVSTFLSPFHLDRLLLIGNPVFFMDLAWNFFPTEEIDQSTVIYFHSFINLFTHFIDIRFACSGMGIRSQEIFIAGQFPVFRNSLLLIAQTFIRIKRMVESKRLIFITVILTSFKLIHHRIQSSDRIYARRYLMRWGVIPMKKSSF